MRSNHVMNYMVFDARGTFTSEFESVYPLARFDIESGLGALYMLHQN